MCSPGKLPKTDWYTVKRYPVSALEKFTKDNALDLVVLEREHYNEGDPMKYYARYEDSYVLGDGVLIGSFGNGGTPEDAVRNWGEKISLKTLVIGAWGSSRREIRVPRIT